MHYANLINANDKLKPMISELHIKLTPGFYSPTPLKESHPEIHNEKLSREKEQINHQGFAGKITPEEVNVDGVIPCS